MSWRHIWEPPIGRLDDRVFIDGRTGSVVTTLRRPISRYPGYPWYVAVDPVLCASVAALGKLLGVLWIPDERSVSMHDILRCLVSPRMFTRPMMISPFMTAHALRVFMTALSIASRECPNNVGEFFNTNKLRTRRSINAREVNWHMENNNNNNNNNHQTKTHQEN